MSKFQTPLLAFTLFFASGCIAEPEAYEIQVSEEQATLSSKEQVALPDDDLSDETETSLADVAGLSLFDDGVFSYYGGIGGKSENVLRSTKCPGYQRSFAEASYLSGRGDCYVVGWLTQDSQDCSVVIHYGVPPLKSGSCKWAVYADQVGHYSYNATNTNSAQQNTINTQIILQPGNTVEVGTCGLPNASAVGDTYLRLIRPDGSIAALNDDACSSLASKLIYTVPLSNPSNQKFLIKAGCFSSGSCGGTVAWKIY